MEGSAGALDHGTGGEERRRRLLVCLVVAAALFMENMDSTVIATSLPAIAVDLHEDPVILKLAFTAYLLSLAVFIPASGWLADRFGTRLVFRSAIIVFVLGSIACGLATSLETLVAARILQGLGGALMVPVGRLVLVRTVPKSELVGALAFVTMPALIGPVVGPPVGGFLTTYFHWRLIFWINVPVGILGLVAATLLIPDIREPESPPLDVKGFILSGLALSLLIFGATLIGRDIASAWLVLGMLAGGVLLALAYVRHARRVVRPIIDLNLLGIDTFRTSILSGFLFRASIGSVPFLLPLLFQLQFGLTAFQSGSLTFAGALGAILMKASARRILGATGFRPVLIGSALLSSAFMAANTLFTPTTPHLVIVAVLLVGGFIRSLHFTSLAALTFADIGQSDASRATSFSGVAQQLAISTGVVIAALALEISRGLRGETALTIADFDAAFLVVACLSVGSAVLYLAMRADAGAELIGRQESKR
ncbi:MAG: MFS transporter [Hyphomicrobiaceae bacterium]